MKINYKKKFFFLAKKTEKEMLFNKKFYPHDKFLKEVFKENHDLLNWGKEIKKHSGYKRLYTHASNIMLKHDDWMFDDRLYVKDIKKPHKPKSYLNKKMGRLFIEAECGDLLLRNKIDTTKDILFLIKNIKKSFNTEGNILKWFSFELRYTYPKSFQIDKLKQTRKFGHYLSLNHLSFPTMSFNHYIDQKRKLLISVDWLDIELNFLKDFIKKLHNLKEIVFDELSFTTDDKISYEYCSKNLNNPDFCNYENKKKNVKLIKNKINNLNKFRKIVDQKIPIKIECFLFEDYNIEYGSII